MHLDYLELLEFMSGPKKDDDAIVYIALCETNGTFRKRKSSNTFHKRKYSNKSLVALFTISQTRRSLAPILSTAKLDADLLYIIRIDMIGKRFT